MSSIIPPISRLQMLCPFGFTVSCKSLTSASFNCLYHRRALFFSNFHEWILCNLVSNLHFGFRFKEPVHLECVWASFRDDADHSSDVSEHIPTKEFLFPSLICPVILDSKALLAGSCQFHARLTHLPFP